MTLGLFGGTFDPPHIGHLIVAQDAAEALALETVIFMPAGQPPHKRGQTISPAALRLRMTRLATADAPGCVVDDREIRRAGPSWTVDTLAELAAERPGIELVLLVGTDQYESLETWKDADRIRSLSRVAVLDREGGGAVKAPRDVRVRVTRIDVSGSDIRERVAAGRPIRHLVAPAVEAVIRSHGLYAGAGDSEGSRDDRNDIAGAG